MGMLSFAFFSVVFSIYVVSNFVSILISVIFGLILCYCLSGIIKNCYMSFAYHESLVGQKELHIVQRVSMA